MKNVQGHKENVVEGFNRKAACGMDGYWLYVTSFRADHAMTYAKNSSYLTEEYRTT
jgi:hypothetical protein